MTSTPKLSFGASHHLDRLLPIQLGELRPEGLELEFRLVEQPTAAWQVPDLDLVEMPLDILFADAGAEWIGLPVFPVAEYGAGASVRPRTVLALRRRTYEGQEWIATALVDAFEAARAAAYKRLKTITSPALALPWLIDDLDLDEREYGRDPFVVGFVAGDGPQPTLPGQAGDLADLFAAETLDHVPTPRAESVQVDHHAGTSAIRCRGLRYVDRTLALEVGAIPTGDLQLSYEAAPSLGGALPAVTSGEVALAEILLGDLIGALAAGDDRIIGLPLFPARRFVQRCFWVGVDSDLSTLEELQGARVGYPPGGATAAACAGAALEAAGVEAAFVSGPVGGALAKMLDRGAGGPTLPELLARGEIAAVVSPYAIPPADGGDRLTPLLADPAAAERAQARAERAMPISNVVAMNRAAYERDPAVVPSLLDAFAAARAAGARSLLADEPTVAMPLLAKRIGDSEALFGGDPYTQGIEANRDLLTRFARHAVRIGAAAREVDVAEMFPPEAAS